MWRSPRTQTPYRSLPRFSGLRGYTRHRPPPFRRIPPLCDTGFVYTHAHEGDAHPAQNPHPTTNNVTHYTGREGKVTTNTSTQASGGRASGPPERKPTNRTRAQRAHTTQAPSNTPTKAEGLIEAGGRRQEADSTRAARAAHPVPRYRRPHDRPTASPTQPPCTQAGRIRPNRAPPAPTPPAQTVLPKPRTPPTRQTPPPQNTNTPNPTPPPPRTRGIPHPAPYHRGMPWDTSNRHANLPTNWTQIRRTILNQTNGRCQGFPTPPTPRPAGGGQWTRHTDGHWHTPACDGHATDVDHIIPAAAGGTNELTNLRPLSHPCHAAATCAYNTARRTALRAARTRPPEHHPGSKEL